MPTLNECFSIADLRKLAIKKLPSVMFDYLEGSAEDELTAEWNRNSFSKYEFVPRVLKDVSKIDLSATFQGVKIELPIVTAPTGMTRMFHWEGEKAVVRATHKAGTAYILSTVATTSIEDVAKESKGPLFFQIYAWHDRKMVYDFIERCKKENYDGLMLAVDLASLGKRERDLRNGHGRPSVLRKNTALSALSKPAWLFNFLTKPKMRMANMVEHLPHLYRVFEDRGEFAAIDAEQKGEAKLISEVRYYGTHAAKVSPDGQFRLKFAEPIAVRERPEWGEYRFIP